ncbi:TPA: hypothetical protein RUV26_002416 [Staphylococcus aureus]|nr:hypothetical protein [Staphylococcus aureus]
MNSEKIYVVYSENFTKAFEEKDAAHQMEKMIKEEFDYNVKHHTTEEFNDYFMDLYISLAPIYIKSQIQNLNENDIQKVIFKFNDQFNYDEDNKLHLMIYINNEGNTEEIVNSINQIGVFTFEKITKIKKLN